MAHTRRTVAELRRAFGGRVALVRHDMGITGFGVQLFDFRPGDDGPPEHDEAGSGQEELYVGRGGSGRIEVDGESLAFGPETRVSIPPGSGERFGSEPRGCGTCALAVYRAGPTSRARSSIVPARPRAGRSEPSPLHRAAPLGASVVWMLRDPPKPRSHSPAS